MKKWICAVLALLALFSITLGVFAAEEKPVLIDNADLLTQKEEEDLIQELRRVRDVCSVEEGFNIVVLTVDSLEGKSPMAYADDYYDYNGYHDNGVLLLIAMESRDWWISTSGSCIDKISADELSGWFLDELKEGQYYDAFMYYAMGVEDSMNAPPVDFFTVLICLVIGGVIALIVVAIMAAQLKTVRPQGAADSYIGKNGLHLTGQSDLFLYQTVSKRVKPQSTSTSSGTHTGSSGRSHGGGGGKF